MKIRVEMEESEVQDFLDYRKEKKTRVAETNRLHDLAELVLRTVGEHKGDYFITDIDYAAELLETAAAYQE